MGPMEGVYIFFYHDVFEDCTIMYHSRKYRLVETNVYMYPLFQKRNVLSDRLEWTLLTCGVAITENGMTTCIVDLCLSPSQHELQNEQCLATHLEFVFPICPQDAKISWSFFAQSDCPLFIRSSWMAIKVLDDSFSSTIANDDLQKSTRHYRTVRQVRVLLFHL